MCIYHKHIAITLLSSFSRSYQHWSAISLNGNTVSWKWKRKITLSIYLQYTNNHIHDILSGAWNFNFLDLKEELANFYRGSWGFVSMMRESQITRFWSYEKRARQRGTKWALPLILAILVPFEALFRHLTESGSSHRPETQLFTYISLTLGWKLVNSALRKW